MKFSLRIGSNNEHEISYSRNWFSGEEVLLANGHPVVEASALSPSTHFNLQFTSRRDFSLPGPAGMPPLLVTFERVRAVMFGGVRPQVYRVFVNGTLVFERKGY